MSETITGTLDAVTEKGDWTTFEINVGTQFPVRLSTKVAELIERGRAAKGQEMEWTFNAVEGNINPKSGKPYINRYFKGVAPVGTNGNPSSVQVGTNATGTQLTDLPQQEADVDWDAKERRDYRSRAWAQTLGAFTHTIKTDESPEDVFLRLQPFQRKVYEDVCQSFAWDDSEIPF